MQRKQDLNSSVSTANGPITLGSEDDNTAPESGRERLRRSHNKSRRGCLSCKRRHVRCDERTPICSSCLLRGLECVYTGPRGDPMPLARILSATPSDPFDCLPILMQTRSAETHYELLNHHRFLVSVLPRDFQEASSIELSSANANLAYLNLSHANPAWLHVSLLLYLSTRLYVSQASEKWPPNYHRTLIHHRLGVIDSLKRDAMAGAISYSTLSLMCGLALADGAAGEVPQALIHVRGVFDILDRIPDASAAYPPLAKRLLVGYQALLAASHSKIRDSTGSYLERVLCSHARHRNAFLSRLANCFFIQIINTYYTEFILTGQFYPDKRGDGNLLEWLYQRLKSSCQGASGMGDQSQNHFVRSQEAHGGNSEKAALEIATMAYVVMVGSLGDPSTHFSSCQRRIEPLQKLRHGMSRVIEQWELSGRLVTEQLVEDFVSMMMWLETEEGLGALPYLINGGKNNHGGPIDESQY